MITLIYPESGSVIDTHTEIQNIFLEMIREKGIDAALQWLLPVKNDRECSYPAEMTFRWKSNGEIGPYRFELSETEDFSCRQTAETAETSCSVTNLKVGQVYFWRVNGGKANRFTTADNGYRFIKIDGALNVRDLGGINIKQGLVYRGSAVHGKINITEAGKKIFLEQLGIKTELDMRKSYNDVFGTEGDPVAYRHIPYRPYMESFEEQQRAYILEAMEIFADESNYPIYCHCLGGADRTGMIALYLRALAGEEDADILADYELTSLSTYALGRAEGVRASGFRSRNVEPFPNVLAQLDRFGPGSPLRETIPAFLKDRGVPEETMKRIVAILRK